MAEAAGRERWSLAGATALVTGGSKGIGHAIVEELASLGARVHTCSRNAAELEECRRRWAEKGLQVTVSVCDVAVRADREALMDAVKDVFATKLDILVNNAAQVIVKPATEYTAEDYARMMATNLESCFHLSQLAHPLLRNASVAGGGSIVHISSTAGCIGFPGVVLYCTTKGRREDNDVAWADLTVMWWALGLSGGGAVLDNNEHQRVQHDTWTMGLAVGLASIGLVVVVSRVALLVEPRWHVACLPPLYWNSSDDVVLEPEGVAAS